MMAESKKRWCRAAALLLGILLGSGAGAGALLQPASASGTEKPESAGGGKGPSSDKELRIRQTAPQWWESRRRIYYDIPARVVLHLPDAGKKHARSLFAGAWAEFERIGKIFNPYDPESETGMLNRRPPTEWTPVSEDLYQVLQTSRKIWRASGGAFDPTFLPVKELWQEAVRKQQIPSQRRIRKALNRTGLDAVSIRAGSRSREIRLQKPGIQFDFGGIAKGYAVDCVVEFLTGQGVESGLVQLGGEIAAFGGKRDRPWRIGIQHPTDMNAVWGLLKSKAGIRVSTSGNYRQPLQIQGHSFYHIFSPQTGRPVSVRVLGVTTAGFSGSHACARLDAAATAITVMGAEAGRNLAHKLGIEALILTRGPNRQIEQTATDGMAALYHRQGNN
jgi:thiamine biosynthesis lipoprotein